MAELVGSPFYREDWVVLRKTAGTKQIPLVIQMRYHSSVFTWNSRVFPLDMDLALHMVLLERLTSQRPGRSTKVTWLPREAFH